MMSPIDRQTESTPSELNKKKTFCFNLVSQLTQHERMREEKNVPYPT